MKIIKPGGIYAYCTFICERCGCVFQAENDEIRLVGDKYEIVDGYVQITQTDEVWCNCPHCGKTCYSKTNSVFATETQISEESQNSTTSVG